MLPMNLPYDPSDVDSISSYADGLVGSTLADTVILPENLKKAERGGLGTYVERLYFQWVPPVQDGADFYAAGLELKTTPVKKLSNGSIVPKERLVLSMINYPKVDGEIWATNSLMKKCGLMLILFYQHERELPLAQYRFIGKHIWDLSLISPEDLKIIQDDWKTITGKVKAGKAHELSEGDTLYLGACTKARNSSTRTSQPNSQITAKPRAFCFKTGYMRAILNRHVLANAEAVVSSVDAYTKDMTFEDIVLAKLKPYYGMTEAQLMDKFAKQIDPKAKNRYALLVNRMLGVKTHKVMEFVKADIQIKTIRLKPNGSPKEDMSFPAFKYMDLAQESDWEDSSFKNFLERRFFFPIFSVGDYGEVRFTRAMFWTMPTHDLIEAERVWVETVKRVNTGRANDLPRMTESHIAHVRPHGRDSKDLIEAPGGKKLVRKSFWLNRSYIKRQVEGI